MKKNITNLSGWLLGIIFSASVVMGIKWCNSSKNYISSSKTNQFCEDVITRNIINSELKEQLAAYNIAMEDYNECLCSEFSQYYSFDKLIEKANLIKLRCFETLKGTSLNESNLPNIISAKDNLDTGKEHLNGKPKAVKQNYIIYGPCQSSYGNLNYVRFTNVFDGGKKGDNTIQLTDKLSKKEFTIEATTDWRGVNADWTPDYRCESEELLIIDDFNFDGKKDVAIAIGGSTYGHFYEYYIQLDNFNFERNEFLSNEIRQLPILDKSNRELIVSILHSYGTMMLERRYSYDEDEDNYILLKEENIKFQ